jgi:hypothetical protein
VKLHMNMQYFYLNFVCRYLVRAEHWPIRDGAEISSSASNKSWGWENLSNSSKWQASLFRSVMYSRQNNLFTFFDNFCIGRPLCLYTLGFLNHWLCAMFYEFDIWFRICSDSGIFVFYLLIDVVSSVRGRVYMIFDMISRDLHM